MFEKYIWLIKSRKAQALGGAFCFLMANWIFGWGLSFGEAMTLMSPIFAWAGVEGIADGARVLAEGIKNKSIKEMTPEQFTAFSKAVFEEIDRRSTDAK